jgi:hypothetical protein
MGTEQAEGEGMAATSAVEWADQQRRLRTEALSPDFDPELRDVTYRLILRREFDDSLVWSSRLRGPRLVVALVLLAVAYVLHWPPLIAVLVPVFTICSRLVELRASATTGSEVALWLPGPTDARSPDLVFRVADDAFASGEASAGAGQAFGEPVPYGVLGVIVGDTVVWPVYPPRRATGGDRRRARRAAERAAA